jgi:2-aminoethylphosphonate-pyruvate transaminase
MKTILLNPGPVTLSEFVRTALLGPDLCHREPEFAMLQAKIRRQLLNVYALDPGTWASILMTGSGTAAVEAMLTSLVPADGKLLVIENGVYGERMTSIARRHHLAHQRLEHPWLAPIDLARVRQALHAAAEFTHVAVVQHETTSGRLNELAALAALCAEYHVELLIDAVSSFGAEALDFAQWPIAAAAATANKCLHGVPGTCFVVAKRSALAGAGEVNRSVYLDLRAYLENQDRDGTPFTQSVQTFYALSAALDELEAEGGWEVRRATYRARLGAVRRQLAALSVRPLLEDAESSCVLNAFELPGNLDYPTLHDALKARGFIIYAGQSTLAQQIFRISTMGDITPEDLARLCSALREIIAPASNTRGETEADRRLG